MEMIETEAGKDFIFKSLADVQAYAAKHNLPCKIDGDGSIILYIYNQQGAEHVIRFVESVD